MEKNKTVFTLPFKSNVKLTKKFKWIGKGFKKFKRKQKVSI